MQLSTAKKLGLYALAAILTFTGSAAIVPTAASADPLTAQFYVDPVNGSDTANGLTTGTAFLTIDRARQAVANVNSAMTGDIHVTLRDGEYPLSTPVTFDESDGGTNGHNVIYEAYPGEHPYISGATDLSGGWTQYDSQKDIWSRPFGSNVETRQLFIDGERATRARSVSTISQSVRNPIDGATMKNWGNLDDVENVYFSLWIFHRVSVDHVDQNNGIVLDSPGSYFHTAYNPGNYWYTENAYELLDEAGEWYLDRSTDTFYYKPKPGQAMNNVQVAVPLLEDLFILQGSDLDHPVQNIQFRGLGFENTTWNRPSSDSGFVSAQNGVIREAKQPSDPDYNGGAFYSRHDWIDGHAAIRVQTAAQNIVIDGCDFRQLGNIGVLFLRGTQDSAVQNSQFIDLGAQAIQLGGDDLDMNNPDYYYPNDNREIVSNVSVVGNYIERIAVETYNAAAIGASWPQDTDISHNEIVNVPYTGIHVGWGWGYIGGGLQNTTGGLGTSGPPPTRNVTIEDNYIHHFMTVMRDGGGIYVNGETQGDNLISGNYVSNMDVAMGTAGSYVYTMIYHDNGASFWTTRDNVIEANTGAGKVSELGGLDRTDPGTWAHDITVENLYTNGLDFHVNTSENTVTNRQVLTDRHYPLAAQAIIEQAGRPGHEATLPGPRVAYDFNAETLAYIAQGATASVITQSDGTWVLLNAESVGDSIDFTLPSIATGAYTLKLRYKAYSQRGIVQAQFPAGTALGQPLNMYASTATYRTATVGTLIASTAGDQTLRFTVTDKQAEATAFALSFDELILESSVLDENFDSDPPGAPPAGWTTTPAGGTVAVHSETVGRDLVANKTQASTTSMTAFKDFVEPVTTGTILTRAQVAQTNVVTYAIIGKSSSGTTAIQVAFGDDAKIWFRDPTGWKVTAMTYVPGRWYAFKVAFDATSDTYDFWVDDAKLATGAGFMSAVSEIGRTGVGIFSGTRTATARYDDISAYEPTL